MTEENGTTWENWERNTEESHEYADFILKELGTITNAVSKECAVFLKKKQNVPKESIYIDLPIYRKMCSIQHKNQTFNRSTMRF